MDRLVYAVGGTPNRLEFDRGFVVKLGDGGADVKPIASLYKTQIYALARHLGVVEAILRASPRLTRTAWNNRRKTSISRSIPHSWI